MTNVAVIVPVYNGREHLTRLLGSLFSHTPQEYARFAWFFLVQKRDVKGFREWLRLHKLGREEKFSRP